MWPISAVSRRQRVNDLSIVAQEAMYSYLLVKSQEWHRAPRSGISICYPCERSPIINKQMKGDDIRIFACLENINTFCMLTSIL